MSEPSQPNQVIAGPIVPARPTLYRADRVGEFTALAAQMMQVAQPPKGAVSVYEGDTQRRLYEMAGNVAVIQVSGVLLACFPYIGYPWATGYDALFCQFAQAFADPEVKAIALLVDSGGGEVADCFDLVDWIMAAKAAAKKPIAAVLAEAAYSAAYAITSTADTIAVPRTGGVGSIGVVSSTGTTASAPAGTGAPVAIRTAVPGATDAVGSRPAAASPTTRSRTGWASVAPATSSERIA